MQVREKTTCSKKSTFSDRLLISFFWKPISKLVIWQIFRIFGHSLTDWHRVKDSVKISFLHLFQYWLFSLKIGPISQFLAKSYDPNTHFRAFFMLFKIQIRKFIKRVFWLIPIITCVDNGRIYRAKSKIFLIFRHASLL